MSDGELEVGYTLVFLFLLFVFVILYLRKPTTFLLRTLTRLPSNTHSSVSESILLLLLYIADF